MISATGSPQSGPMRIGVPVVDITTGLYAAIGILMALSERQTSGLGQFLETTLYESGLAVMHPHAANYFMHGKPPRSPATSIRTWCRMRSSRPGPTTSSSASAMTAPSASSAKRSASPNSAPIRALPATRTASPIARRCAPSSPPSSASTMPSRYAIGCSPPACRPVRCSRSIRRSPAPTPSIAATSSRRTGTRALPRRSGLQRSKSRLRQDAAEIQPARHGGAVRIRLFQRRDQGPGGQGRGLRPRAEAVSAGRPG